MATQTLLDFFEDEFFDTKDFQNDLPTFFDDEVVSDFLDEAIKKGKKRKDWTEAGFERQKENWRDILDEHKAPELDNQIIKNNQKGLSELASLTNVSTDGKVRVDDRQEKISVEIINESKNLDDLNVNFDNITANLGDISKGNEISIESAQAVKSQEFEKEKTGVDITRADLDVTTQRSINSVVKRFNVSEDEARIAVVREGFTLSENERTFKQ